MTDAAAKASCHCGAVEIEFAMVGALEDLRRCDCSLCRRVKPAAVTSRVDELSVAKGQDRLSLYQFGTMTAKHWFCSICGTHVYHQRRSNPNEYGINIGCVHDVDPRLAGEAAWVDGVDHPSDTGKPA